MIEEQFVSFDTAKMLKETGFEEMVNSCFMYDDNADEYEYEFVSGYAIVKKALRDNYNGYENTISRPTQALAERWLREVYNVAIYSLYDDDMEQWFYVVDAFTKNPVINGFQSGSEYDDYESAFEDGLREAIKLIKK